MDRRVLKHLFDSMAIHPSVVCRATQFVPNIFPDLLSWGAEA
jgi:hypothetical protein